MEKPKNPKIKLFERFRKQGIKSSMWKKWKMKIKTCNMKEEVTLVEIGIQWKSVEAVLASLKANALAVIKKTAIKIQAKISPLCQ